MTLSTGVTAILQCSHRDRDGQLHGHSWEVSAETNAEPFRDARALQARLDGRPRQPDEPAPSERFPYLDSLAVQIGVGAIIIPAFLGFMAWGCLVYGVDLVFGVSRPVRRNPILHSASSKGNAE